MGGLQFLGACPQKKKTLEAMWLFLFLRHSCRLNKKTKYIASRVEYFVLFVERVITSVIGCKYTKSKLIYQIFLEIFLIKVSFLTEQGFTSRCTAGGRGRSGSGNGRRWGRRGAGGRSAPDEGLRRRWARGRSRACAGILPFGVSGMARRISSMLGGRCFRL